MRDDLAAIEEWATIFLDLKKLSYEITYNFVKNEKQFKKDIVSILADWDAKNYFKTGVDVSGLLTLALGPISESYLLAKFGVEEDVAVQKYLAYSQF